MVAWVDHVVTAFFQTHQFQRNVSYNFVGVHVYGSTGTALIYVSWELVHALASSQNQITGFNNHVADIRWDCAQFFVGQRSGFLHHHHAAYELWYVRNSGVGDVKVLDSAQSMDAVVSISRNFAGTQQVFFDTNIVSHNR